MNNALDRSFKFSVTDKDADQRLDFFLTIQVEEITRSKIQDFIRKGHVKVNDLTQKTSYRLKKGDQICLSVPYEPPFKLEPEPIQFSIIYEDQSLIVLNKPPDLVIHPAPGHSKGTLVHGLLQHCKELSNAGGEFRPGIVHRLDKDTSGIMIVAKNDNAHISLSKQFKEGAIEKRYIAIVHGIPNRNKGELELPIGRHPQKRKKMTVHSSRGKNALTRWEVRDKFGDSFSSLIVVPKTGRTHQIRVHLSHIGHPILGDSVYGFKRGGWKKHLSERIRKVVEVERQMLHAETIKFVHPDSKKECDFRAPVPADMSNVLNELEKYRS